MIKILSVIGTRPEGIKMAPVIQELSRRAESSDLQIRVCVTGQHREMLDQVLDLFDIVPDLNFNLMQPGQTPTQVAARVMLALEPVLQEERPDWILVQGDTTTVMAAALVAHHYHVKVAHIEAGLRTGDRNNPFPEEMNRVVTSHLSDLHFAPTEQARQNLLREGIAADNIYVTGNTVIDALLAITDRPAHRFSSQLFDDGLPPKDKELILVTAHRRENFGEPLERICQAIRTLSQRWPNLLFVYSVHLNPNVYGPVHAALGDLPGVKLVPPLDYLTLVHLLKASYLVMTDSGGIQEEAPSLGKPVLVLRDVTERPEAVEAGAARLVGTNTECIVREAERLLNSKTLYTQMARAVNPYGDGCAAKRIVDVLQAYPQVPLHANWR